MLYLIDESGNIPMSSPSTTEKAINEKAKTEQQVRSGNSPDTYDESSSEDGQPHQYHDSLSTLNEVSGEDSAKNTSGNLTDNTLSVQRF